MRIKEVRVSLQHTLATRTELVAPQDVTTYTHDLINRLTEFSTAAITANYVYEPESKGSKLFFTK